MRRWARSKASGSRGLERGARLRTTVRFAIHVLHRGDRLEEASQGIHVEVAISAAYGPIRPVVNGSSQTTDSPESRLSEFIVVIALLVQAGQH